MFTKSMLLPRARTADVAEWDVGRTVLGHVDDNMSRAIVWSMFAANIQQKRPPFRSHVTLTG